MDYKGYLIILEKYHWGFEAVAIPDHGETIRKKFIGYNKREMIQAMKSYINYELNQAVLAA